MVRQRREGLLWEKGGQVVRSSDEGFLGTGDFPFGPLGYYSRVFCVRGGWERRGGGG